MIEYTSVKNLAELCNGSTADSDSVRLGSNPGSAAKENRPSIDGLFSFFVCRTADSHTASCHRQELGSHTPTEVRQARLAGEGRGYLRYRRISCVENIPHSGIWRLRGNTKRLVLHLALLTYLLHASHILRSARPSIDGLFSFKLYDFTPIPSLTKKFHNILTKQNLFVNLFTFL